jgi:hypothetical protein
VAIWWAVDPSPTLITVLDGSIVNKVIFPGMLGAVSDSNLEVF